MTRFLVVTKPQRHTFMKRHNQSTWYHQLESRCVSNGSAVLTMMLDFYPDSADAISRQRQEFTAKSRP
jgi:hypothetical protein